ncbi:Hypothetical protein UVM_LOCUS145 [uncultured virus]|nr:Hypothetical protein UVM_LOCUS145 [uncultured virus]
MWSCADALCETSLRQNVTFVAFAVRRPAGNETSDECEANERTSLRLATQANASFAWCLCALFFATFAVGLSVLLWLACVLIRCSPSRHNLAPRVPMVWFWCLKTTTTLAVLFYLVFLLESADDVWRWGDAAPGFARHWDRASACLWLLTTLAEVACTYARLRSD